MVCKWLHSKDWDAAFVPQDELKRAPTTLGLDSNRSKEGLRVAVPTWPAHLRQVQPGFAGRTAVLSG
jgi:hypothetical protein